MNVRGYLSPPAHAGGTDFILLLEREINRLSLLVLILAFVPIFFLTPNLLPHS